MYMNCSRATCRSINWCGMYSMYSTVQYRYMYIQCTQITIYMYCKATVHVNPIKYSIILHLEWENQGNVQCTCSSINWCGMYSMYSTVQIHVHTMYTNTMYM